MQTRCARRQTVTSAMPCLHAQARARVPEPRSMFTAVFLSSLKARRPSTLAHVEYQWKRGPLRDIQPETWQPACVCRGTSRQHHTLTRGCSCRRRLRAQWRGGGTCDVLGDDDERLVDARDLLQQRDDVLDGLDLHVRHQHARVVVLHDHLLLGWRRSACTVRRGQCMAAASASTICVRSKARVPDYPATRSFLKIYHGDPSFTPSGKKKFAHWRLHAGCMPPATMTWRVHAAFAPPASWRSTRRASHHKRARAGALQVGTIRWEGDVADAACARVF